MKVDRAYPNVTVTPKAEAAILRGHPWVYDAEILSMEGTPENGGLVDVRSRKGAYLGTGFLSEKSKIRVRLISRNANDRFDDAFWERKLRWAWEYRKTVMAPEDLDACRVIFGEADMFPGLTVDKFHDLLRCCLWAWKGSRTCCCPCWFVFFERMGRPFGAFSSGTTLPSGRRRGWSSTRAGFPCLGRLRRILQ